MSRHSLSLLCFNADTKSPINKSYYRNAKPDLCFFQEIKKDEIAQIKSSLLESSGCDNEYDCKFLQELVTENSPASCNCLFYNKKKLSVFDNYVLDERSYTKSENCPRIVKSFEEKLKYGDDEQYRDDPTKGNPLKKRICVVILQYTDNGNGWNPKIIAVTFHNPSKYTGKTANGKSIGRTSNAAHFFEALDYLGQATGYPIVVGGDFNCELLKKRVNTNGFIVLNYNPTIYRVYKERIDFFAYKNYGGCIEIEVNDVHADILRLSEKGSPIKSESDQYYIDYKERYCCKYDSSESDHDPLRATLIIKALPCSLTISYYNVNDDQSTVDCLAKMNHTSDLVVLHNNGKSKELRLNDFNQLQIPKIPVYQVYFKNFKFRLQQPEIEKIHTCCLSKFCSVALHHHEDSRFNIVFTLIDTHPQQKSTKTDCTTTQKYLKDITKCRDDNSCVTAMHIMLGDVTVTPAEFLNSLSFHIKCRELPSCLSLKPADGCLIAYSANDMPLDHLRLCRRLSDVNPKIRVITDVITTLETPVCNDQHTLKPEESVDCLCFNMESTDSSCFINMLNIMNPKPDLVILQNTTQETQTKISEIFCSGQYKQSTFVDQPFSITAPCSS